ncbi:transposase, partial [Desulfobacterium sp. N47]|uniref:transposase n=1 Tax=Desulfobacterium sp. N47 TaxID=3115210 RepID=UPI003F4A1451
MNILFWPIDLADPIIYNKHHEQQYCGVKPNYGEMSWLIFQEDFQSEDDCYAWLLKTRWPEGFICPKCGSKDYWSI